MARRIVLTIENDEHNLRQVSKPVVDFNEKLHTLLDDMYETMVESKGVGLAAPQIGILKRVFIVDGGTGDKTKKSDIIEFINPQIIKQSGTRQGEEGCLSIPEKKASVVRPKRLIVTAQNRHGEYFTIRTNDSLMCAAFCHELDHLNGVLYTDKAVNKN